MLAEPMSDSQQDDPFTGTWRFNAERSKLSTPAPRDWIQRIVVSADQVLVQEDIMSASGSQMVVSVHGRFDTKEYAVSGSPLADTISYARVDRHKITGTGRKNEGVSFRETLTVSPADGTLTLSYSIYAGIREAANGIAVFEKV
jgi:hypothetical protein